MEGNLLNCWEILDCGKAEGGVNARFGECVAAREGFGHSCWAIAGTLCCGEVRARVAQQEHTCITCEVYRMYNRINGTLRKAVMVQYPEEDARYNSMLMDRMNSRMTAESQDGKKGYKDGRYLKY